jgi:hypothetical protein
VLPFFILKRTVSPVAKLKRTMFVVRYEGKYEEFYFQSWAIHAARMLKQQGIDVEVTYDEYVIFVFVQLTPFKSYT